MNAKEFCFWLRGYFDLAELNRKKSVVDGVTTVKSIEFTPDQILLMRNHLKSIEELKK